MMPKSLFGLLLASTPSIWFHIYYFCKICSDPTTATGTHSLFQVRIMNLIHLILPTTSPATVYQRHTNAKVFRVYKYPHLVMVLTQVRFGLNILTSIFLVTPLNHSSIPVSCFNPPAEFFNHIQYGLNIIPLFVSANLFLFSTGYKRASNFFGVFLDTMSSSPRSVLDAGFQCEAAPICIVERHSASLAQALNRTLAGRLLTSRRPSVANLTLAVSRLWNCAHQVRCFDHGKCLYSFEFTSAPVVENVVSGGPWYVNGDLLLISRMDPNMSIEQLLFSHTKLWVRCYDLPPKCFTKDYAAAIGNSLGRYCDTDLPSDDPEEAKLLVQSLPTVRKYLRVKFDFNLYGPLKSTQSIKICNAKKVVVEEHVSRLTYERLPHTCFRCGYIGHLVDACPFDGPLLYGEWIRAERFFRINLQNVTIPKTISTNKEGQSSTSQRVVNQVVQVSNIEELVTSMVNDPNIIKANFSQARAEGIPPSKGKSHMLPLPQNNSMVPYTSVSPSKSSPTTVFGPHPDSILGSAPSFPRPSPFQSPIGPGSSLIDSDEGQFVAFLNSISSNEEGFTTNTSRCLFNKDPPFPSDSTGISSVIVSPSKTLALESAAPQVGKSSGHLSEVFKEEIKKIPTGRKRAQGNGQTPRPKRGRQAPSDGQA